VQRRNNHHILWSKRLSPAIVKQNPLLEDVTVKGGYQPEAIQVHTGQPVQTALKHM
jgi:plastocyanin domain-containing protein